MHFRQGIREPGRLAYGRIDTAPYLARTVQSVLRLPQRPDAVVITGDLTDFGHGTLCAQRLNWLAVQLEAARDEPVIIAMHHPPFRTLIGHMDEIGLLEGAEELARLPRARLGRRSAGHAPSPHPAPSKGRSRSTTMAY